MRLKIRSLGCGSLKHHGALIDKPAFLARVVFHGAGTADADDGDGHGGKCIEYDRLYVPTRRVHDILKWRQHEDGACGGLEGWMARGGVGELEGVEVAADTEETKVWSFWQVFGGTIKRALLSRCEVGVKGPLVPIETACVAFVAVVAEGYALAVPLELGIIVFDGGQGNGREIREGLFIGGGRGNLWERAGPCVA